MPVDDNDLTAGSVTLRLRSTGELSAARHRCRQLFADAGVSTSASDANVLAISELLTNALEAIEPGGSVTAVASVSRVPGGQRTQRIDVDILNTGEPMVGRLEVDASAVTGHQRHRGRGLAVAGRAGDVVVEGLVGGTRARLRSVVDDPPDGLIG